MPFAVSEPFGTLLICVNRRFRLDEPSCAARGSLELAARLEEGVRAGRINVKIERSVCLGHCATGPTLRLIPGGKFFDGSQAGDGAAILDQLKTQFGRRGETDSAESLPPFGS